MLRSIRKEFTSFWPVSCKPFLFHWSLQNEIHPGFYMGLHLVPKSPKALENKAKTGQIQESPLRIKSVPFPIVTEEQKDENEAFN